jgi:hypothetical protein
MARGKNPAGKAMGEGLMKFLRTTPKLAPEPEDTLQYLSQRPRPSGAWTGHPPVQLISFRRFALLTAFLSFARTRGGSLILFPQEVGALTFIV